MANQPHLNSDSNETADRRWASLRQKLADLLPPMWRGNHTDMPHITRDRIWFLRESRFLFFTRNGPVEITLKPTVVLASALIGMVGVSVVFLSTIFASYSAIEVMRDESIQTAQASITATDHHAQRTTSMVPGGANGDDTVTWQGDITPHNNASDLNSMIAGKTATAPKPLPSRFNTQPQINAPSLTELSGNTAPERLPILPEIIHADDKQDTHQASTPPENFRTTDNKDTKEVNIAKAEATDSNLQSDAPIMDLALATTPAQQAPRSILSTEQIPDQALDQMAGGTITDAPPLTLPESNSAEYASTESENEDSFVRTAAGFAIAMLPRLFSDPDPAPKSEQDKTQPLTDNGDDMAAGPLDDGFAITAHSGRTGPMLPSVSDAARAQKMLLSLDGEINYIRKSISQLGIKTDYLPRYDTAKTNTKDTDFKQLLITLAEHRAALRKIPFKTPMLYFYISSEYGHREQPKTGKKSFHHGIDLAGTWQENVRSTAPGTVVFAGREGSFGKVVRIEHDYGISTLYAHLSRITVSVGDYVAENTVIGKMGNTGRSAGSHLHYEIQVDGKSVDPSDFFTIGRQMSVSGELRQTSLTD
jgi:hypothetical protein